MPKSAFLNMFGRSPIRPIEEHMAKVHACVQELKVFFDAVFAENWEQVQASQKNIAQLEHEADILKRDIRLHLPNNLFMSVSRSDLLELLSVQDCLANKAKDIAGIICGRRMSFPQEIAKHYLAFLNRSIEASHQANIAIHELDELLETSFSGTEVEIVDSMITQLSNIENETDKQQIELRRALFDLEKSLPPIDVMFLYKVIEWTGELADRAREIGDRLQILLAR